MLQFAATVVIFSLAILGLAAGMLLGRRGLSGGCRGGAADDAEGCGRPGCCSSVPDRRQSPPLVELQLRTHDDGVTR